MECFWQRDPRWRDRLVHPSKQTLGRIGCTICCIADVSSLFGQTWSPMEVEQRCEFTADGSIYWQSVDFPTFKFLRREYGYDHAAVSLAMRSPDMAVIFEVQDGAHWVAPVRWGLLLNAWTIKDPWTGKEESLRKYGNKVTGCAYFKRK